MAKNKSGWLKRTWSRLKRWNHSFWQWYKGIFKGRPWYIKLLSGLGTFVVCVLLFVIAVSINFLWLFGKSPSISEIMHPKTNNASYIYSADGELLGKYYSENRTPVKYEEIAPVFFDALIDTEDERFYSHHGIDYGGVLAAVKDNVMHGKSRGASTITQQLVKNMFKVRTKYSTGLLGKIPGLGILISKTKEWILATEIEIFYDKKEILTMYANTVDFGNNSFGIKTAARTYFNTSPDSLNTEQCAVLVGLLKATSAYNPKQNPKNSLKRRNVVLHNMYTHNHLTKAQFDSISQIPIELKFNVERPDNDKALYFKEAVKEEMRDWCEANGVDFETDGLKIYTTLDSRMQKYAEEAVVEQMYQIQQSFNHHWGSQDFWIDEHFQIIPNFLEDVASRTEVYKQLEARFPNNNDSVMYYMNQPHKMQLFEYQRDPKTGKIVGGYKEEEMSSMDSIRYALKFMHAGLVAMDPRTGFVKAWVGDIDFNTWKYDKVKSMRQPGSTFKLFVYTAAMEVGMNPCTRYKDHYISMPVYNEQKREMEDYAPHNANGRFTNADMTLRQAFVQSINSISVQVGTDPAVGMNRVETTAYEMGIKSPLRPDMAKEAKPSLCLGAMDVNLLELVDAYATVAAGGWQRPPVLVSRIVRVEPDGSETEIYNYKEYTEKHQAITARSAYLMQRMLIAGTTDPGATSMSLNRFVGRYSSAYGGGKTDFGGKTGTSNNHSDAWFVGVSPHLVAGVWVGGEYRSIHFRTGKLGQGSRTALPVCGAFFQKVWDDAQLRPLVEGHFKNIGISESEYNCDYMPALEDFEFEDSSFYYLDDYEGDSLDLGVPEDGGESMQYDDPEAPVSSPDVPANAPQGNKQAVPPRQQAPSQQQKPVPEPNKPHATEPKTI
ncbi:MAG: transglycosylase domain-containing protein [Muribaculaceae bacterium]|nr:transglycosylase domain-containing protein [Muribaculaceae bacterium]MBQ5466987.1 transglycosylase domain-containing protein [Muribaculaceae bacterium]